MCEREKVREEKRKEYRGQKCEDEEGAVMEVKKFAEEKSCGERGGGGEVKRERHRVI